MGDQKHIVAALEKLIEICRDGQAGYREAGEHASDPGLKKLFGEISLNRARFAGDLENETLRLGKADVDRSGSALGAIQRGWASLRANLGGGDDAILSSMESGDDYARSQYDMYIRDNQLPEDILGIIRNQAQAIVGMLDRIRALRQRRRAA
ncbi:MAG TPA: PA2169 family four-helix-bundle protein [Candidatus Binatia bacterium]|nr:PA2169 family four-helix-bundle protein [Candidatus Binatia bacterium]